MRTHKASLPMLFSVVFMDMVGFGFIIGPLFGGLLSQFGLAVLAFVAAGIAFINLFLIGFVLSESLTRIAGPLAGGALLGLLGPRMPGITASILAAYTAWFGYRFLIKEDCLAEGGAACSKPATYASSK